MRKVTNIKKIPYLTPEVATKVVPSPTDGWDAISPLAAMDPKRAAILDNWVPRPGWVELRGGYIPWTVPTTSDPVETLLVRRGPTGEKMFAAIASSIYDVSDQGEYTEAVTGLSSARWQYVSFTPANGTTVIQAVNGADAMRMYNGSAWSTPTMYYGGNLLDSSTFININAQKRRFWYIVKDSTTAYFSKTDQISGTAGGGANDNIAGLFDFGALWSKGGYLVAMSSWTVDGGSGPQDYAVFISSRGQVALYSGTNPADATAWTLVGIFDLSPPIGYRCMLRVGSDVAIITQQGIIPISQALPFDPSADRSVSITARIQNAMAQAAQQAQDNFGWQLISFPAQQLAILNVPLAEGQLQHQYVMNVLTGAWCRFTGWNANCFEIFEDKLFFGGNEGQVCQAYVGSADFVSSINADMQCAFNWFEDPGRTKRMTMIQPLLVTGGSVSPTLAVDTDFQSSTTAATVSSINSSVNWDDAEWDDDSWPAESQAYNRYLSVQALGHAMAVRMKLNILPYTAVDELGVFDVGQFDSAVFDNGLQIGLPVLQVNAFNVILEMGAAI